MTESGLQKLRDYLQHHAKFVKRTVQSDTYYTPPNRNFVSPKYPYEWLSIRERGGKAILNYKHFHPENAEVTTHCDEHETIVEKPEQLKKMLAALNFKELVVEKEREVFVVDDRFEIALDVVKDLGAYIEIEALQDFGGVEKTKEELFLFASSIGFDVSQPELRGYPYLMMRKKGLLQKA